MHFTVLLRRRRRVVKALSQEQMMTGTRFRLEEVERSIQKVL